MKYEVTYCFSENNEKEEKMTVSRPEDAVSIVEKMKEENDVVYIYNNESCEQLEISVAGNGYLIRDFLRNGFYRKQFDRSDLITALSYFDNPSRDPLSIGMESFE